MNQDSLHKLANKTNKQTLDAKTQMMCMTCVYKSCHNSLYSWNIILEMNFIRMKILKVIFPAQPNVHESELYRKSYDENDWKSSWECIFSRGCDRFKEAKSTHLDYNTPILSCGASPPLSLKSNQYAINFYCRIKDLLIPLVNFINLPFYNVYIVDIYFLLFYLCLTIFLLGLKNCN